MKVEFADDDLEQLSQSERLDAKFPPGIGKIYRKRIQYMIACIDERALYALKSLRYEELKGKRTGQYFVRLNKQYRLVFRYSESEREKTILVLSVEDYH